MAGINYLNEESPSKQGRQQEKKARLHINSGAVWFDKNDLTVVEANETYEVDVKKVVKQKSFTFSLEKLDSFYKNSVPKTPIYLIYIGDYVIKAVIQRSPNDSSNNR